MATAKRQAVPVVTYTCGLCPKKCEAKPDALLALLQLCDGCQKTRFSTGLAAQRKAEAAEVARG